MTWWPVHALEFTSGTAEPGSLMAEEDRAAFEEAASAFGIQANGPVMQEERPQLDQLIILWLAQQQQQDALSHCGCCGQTLDAGSLLGHTLDLYQLWRAVAQRGGHEEVRPLRIPSNVGARAPCVLAGGGARLDAEDGEPWTCAPHTAGGQAAWLRPPDGHLVTRVVLASQTEAGSRQRNCLAPVQDAIAPHSLRHAGAGRKAEGMGPHRA